MNKLQSKSIQTGDVSKNFEGAEDFIKQRIEEIRDRKTISVEDVCVLCFIVVCYVIKESLQSLTHFKSNL